MRVAMIHRMLQRLWNSPTGTAWANQGAEAVRMVVLLPLLLAALDQVQVAVWLLFASLTFFSDALNNQLSQTFSRSISLAYGGASDLSPILVGGKPRGTGEPNWPTIAKVYGTIGSLNRLLSAFGVLLTFTIGYFAIKGIVTDYTAASRVWTAFAFMLAGQYVQQNFRRYAVALRGLNQVALTNRWQGIFSLFSAFAGVVAIQMGADIVGLAMVTQVFVVIGVLRLRFFLRRVEAGRFKNFPSSGWDKPILRWLWAPAWRGLVQVLANRGGVKAATVVYAHHADPLSLSTVLIALKVLEIIEKISIAPITSNVPKFSYQLSSGKLANLKKNFILAAMRCQIFLIVGITSANLLAAPVILAIGSEVRVLEPAYLTVLSILFYLGSTIRQTLILSAIGNKMLAVGRLTISLIISVLLAITLIPMYDKWGFALSAYLPIIILVNYKPLQHGIRMFK
jgi:hypothetical protein